MSDNLSSSEESRGENNLFGKHKWRAKLFSADTKFTGAAGSLESTDDDVANLLHTAGARSEAGPRSAPLAPRLDVVAASKQPSAASADQDDSIVDVYRRPKPRQNKGLRVRFESGPPAIIGRGGDEAELPSRDVSRSIADPTRSETSPGRGPSSHSTNDQRSHAHGRSTGPCDEASFQLLCLRRRPTGIDDEMLAEEPYLAGNDREAVRSALSGIRTSSPQPRNEEKSLDLELVNRDVKKLSYSPSSASEDLSHDRGSVSQTAEFGSHGFKRHLDVPLPEALPVNHLIPREPPGQSYVSQQASLPSYYFAPAPKDLPKIPDSRNHGVFQDSQDFSRDPEDGSLSLRSVAENLGDESLEDFDSRVRRFNDLFRLNASAHVDIMSVPFERWLKVSAWWFLKGRRGLESAMRKPSAIAPASGPNDGEFSSILKQGYVSLAKAWWVLKEIIPNLPVLRKFGNASMRSTVTALRISGDKSLAKLGEIHLGILANFRALTISMKRNARLPPGDLQMQRFESQVFMDTPTFPPDIAALMVNNVLDTSTKGKNYVTNPFFPIMVGDTERHYSFGKMFVDAFWDSRDEAESGVHIPCVVTVLRERSDWMVKAAVASQDGQVNLVIQQSGEHGGLDWHDVQWQIPLHTMQLGLAGGICLQIKFPEKDFKNIWGIYDYTQRIRKEFSARRGEEILYERKLSVFQCFDSPSFPAEPIKDCRVRLFERSVVSTEGSGKHRAHDGYRLMVVTPPGTKALSKLNYQLGKDSPILFSTHESKGGNTLLVRVPSSLRLSLTFHEASDVELFRSTLAGTSITELDHCSSPLHLHNFTISSMSADHDMACINASRCISDLRWHVLRVVNRRQPVYGHDSQSTIGSESLRILADCGSGTFTDRLHAEPGELQLNLSVENLNEMNLLRAAQQDMTWGFTDGALREAELDSLSHMSRSMGTSPSVRTYHFRSLSDLHSFQAMLTGFHVLYDGLASTFSISRPRMVVPMHKRWEASTPRLQIIEQDKTVQLVAFFKDFSHGACMNFVLKVTDFFETFVRSGIFFLRIVDAKFALPKGESHPAKEFVCLDMPDYPSEHDDIVIGFENELERDRLVQTLPAKVNKMSRMASLRRGH